MTTCCQSGSGRRATSGSDNRGRLAAHGSRRQLGRDDEPSGRVAVGEPPFPLGMSELHALSDAAASVADHRICPRLDAPATPERVLMAIERLKGGA